MYFDIAFPQISNISFWIFLPSLTLLFSKNLVIRGTGTDSSVYPSTSTKIAQKYNICKKKSTLHKAVMKKGLIIFENVDLTYLLQKRN